MWHRRIPFRWSARPGPPPAATTPQLWFTGLSGDRSGEVLCLAPIMREGSCLPVPTVETDTALADFNDAACGSIDRHRCPGATRVESRSLAAVIARGQVPLLWRARLRRRLLFGPK